MRIETPLTSIPHFLIASTPDELRRLTLMNNLKQAIVFKYFDFQQMQSGDWICWYFHDIDINSLVKDKLTIEREKV